MSKALTGRGVLNPCMQAQRHSDELNYNYDKDVEDYMRTYRFRKMIVEFQVPDNVHSLRGIRLNGVFGSESKLQAINVVLK